MSEEKEKAKDNDIIGMTTETIAGDLLGMLVKQLKLLPDIWVKVNEHEQRDFIARMRENVYGSVRQAVKLIASNNRITVQADLKKVVFADEVQAVFTIGMRDPGRLELADSRGKACLIVVTDAQAHMGGAEDVKPMKDQPDLNGIDQTTNGVIEQAKRRSKPPGEPKPKEDPKPDGDPLGE